MGVWTVGNRLIATGGWWWGRRSREGEEDAQTGSTNALPLTIYYIFIFHFQADKQHHDAQLDFMHSPEFIACLFEAKNSECFGHYSLVS